jgi:serine/threonine protein kinase
VALKILLSGLSSDPTFQRRIEREARHIASLKSANVVGIYDVGSSQDGPFIVMELVTGPSLRELLDQSGSLAPEQASSVAKEVLSALKLAHRDGLVHRDIKPSNILMTSEGVAKLTDFGISRSVTQTTEITAAGLFTGTITYSAPEQLAGDDVGDSSDLYSLGCVLYECLSGHPPFESDDVNRLAFQQRFADPPPISDLVDGLSPDLADCVMRALEKEPGSRQQSASAMLAEIKAASLDPPSESTVQLAFPKATKTDRRTTFWRERRRIGSAKGRRNTRIWLAAVSLVVVASAAAVVVWRPWAQRIGSSTLSSGADLKPNSTLSSPNGRYRLVMQPTGSLTLQLAGTGEPIWATGSGGHPGAYAVMTRDGNLEVYPGVGTPVPGRQRSALYQTSTSGHDGATLHVLDDGNVVVEDPNSGRWLWQSGSGPASLGPKLITTQGLHPLQYMRSPNGAFELSNDGWTGQLRLIAVRSPNCAMWVEPASGLPASVSALLPDGELVMLAPLAHQTWSSGTSGNPNVQLDLGNDGALTLTSPTGAVVWQAPTAVSQTAGCKDK